MKKLFLLLALLFGALSSSAQVKTARMLDGIRVVTVSGAIQTTDVTKLVVFNCASACAITLPAATTPGFGVGSIFSMRNVGVGTATINGNISNVPAGSGTSGASLILTTNQGTDLYSSGTDYQLDGITNSGALAFPGVPTGACVGAQIAMNTANGNIYGCAAGTWTLSGGSGSPTGPAGGDLSGTYPNPGVAKINGVTVNGVPTANQVPVASNGTTAAWAAAPASPPSGAAGGDLTGTYPNPTISKISGVATVPSGGSLAATGTGANIASNTNNGSGAPSNPCTNGGVYTDNLTGNLYSCNNLLWTVVGTQSASNPNLINPSLFGVKADGKIFYSSGSTIGVTAASTAVTCNNCNFTVADVGKGMEATTGCCGGLANAIGTLQLAITPISAFVSSTQVTLASPASGSCTAPCILGYGTNDDAAWSAVDTAVNSSSGCSTILIPYGYSFIKEPHFNPAGAALCNQTSSGHNYNYTFLGGGKYSSMFVLQSDFDWAACVFGVTTNGCFFTYTQVVGQSFGMTGLGWAITGTHTKNIINPGLGSEFNDINLLAFGGADTAAAGFVFNQTRVKFLACDGFGGVCGKTVNGSLFGNYCYYCFWGDTAKDNFQVISSDFHDWGGQYGLVSGVGQANIRVTGTAGAYYGWGCAGGFNKGQNGASTVGLWVVQGVAYVDGCSFILDGVTTNLGAAVTTAGKMWARNTLFKGGATGFALNTQDTSIFTDGGGNQFQSANSLIANSIYGGQPSITGSPLVTGNIALTSGWDTSTKGTISGDSHNGQFTITAAGTPTAAPVTTITFPNAFIQIPTCKALVVGGTGLNVPTPFITNGAVTTAVFPFTFTGATPAAGNTYVIQYSCN